MESRPYVENVTITPQVAQMMLEHNTHNRNLTASRAQAYARDMASGNWRYTGEGIKFGPDGTLLDGQTRLRAIVLSGVTITMPVWRGIDPDAQLVMDSGRPRSNSAALSLRGEKDVVTLRAIICADFQWCHYGAQSAFTPNGKRRVTPSEMLDWLAIRPDLREAVRYARALYEEDPSIPRSVYGVLWYELGLISPEDRDKFFSDFAAGIGRSASDPLVALRKAAAAAAASSNTRVRSAQYRAALVIRAWNAFRDGVEIKHIAWRTDAKFPLPR